MSKKETSLDPRVRRTKQLLREALIKLIPEKGYENLRVQDITDRATLNRATFYLHYRNKDDLLERGMREIMDELTDKSPPIEKTGDQYSFEAARQSFILDFEHFKEYADFYRVMLGENGVWRFFQQMQDYIFNETIARLKQFKEVEESEVSLETDLAVSHLAAGYIGMIQWWLKHDMPYSPEEMAENVLKIHRDGSYQVLGYEVNDDSFQIA